MPGFVRDILTLIQTTRRLWTRRTTCAAATWASTARRRCATRSTTTAARSPTPTSSSPSRSTRIRVNVMFEHVNVNSRREGSMAENLICYDVIGKDTCLTILYSNRTIKYQCYSMAVFLSSVSIAKFCSAWVAIYVTIVKAYHHDHKNTLLHSFVFQIKLIY